MEDSYADSLNLHEAGKLLGLHEDTVRKLVRTGVLRAIRGIGPRGHWKVSRAAITEYLRQREQTSPDLRRA
jgi:excisionase family DNA binding protein